MATPSYLTDPDALRAMAAPGAQTEAPPVSAPVAASVPAPSGGPSPSASPAPAAPAMTAADINPDDPISLLKAAAQQGSGTKFGGSTLGALGAGGYSALNSALLGIPDAIVKRVSQPAYSDLKKLEAANPGATLAGTTAGYFVPGLGELGLAGKALEAGSAGLKALKAASAASKIDELLNVAKGGEGISKLAQGAASGLVQSAPRAAVQGLDTGDWGGAGTEALAGTVGGAALGKVLGGVAAKAPQLTDDLATASDKALIDGALGINSTKAFKKVLGPNATVPQIEQAYQKSADLIRQIAGNNEGLIAIKPVLKDFVTDTGQTWNAFARNFDEARPLLADSANMNNIAALPAVQNLTDSFGAEGQNALESLIEKVDRSPTFASKRGLLDAYANAGFKSDDPMKQYLGQAARGIKGQIDDMALQLTPDTDLGQMKQVYSALLPIKKMLQMAEIKGENVFREGSQTAGRLLASTLAEHGPSSLGLGLINPAYGASMLAGDVATKTIPQLANKATAAIGAKLGPVLRSEGAQNVASMLGQNAAKVAGGAGKLGAGIAGGIGAVQGLAPTQEEETAASQVPGGQQALAEEANAPTGAASMAKWQTNQDYMQTIENRLQTQYQTRGFMMYMPYDQFVQEVAQATHNFDPKFSARLLFEDPRDQADYLKTYNTYLQKSTIDLNGALQHASQVQPLAGLGERIETFLRNPGALGRQKSYSDMLDMLQNVSGKSRQEVENTVNQIANLNAPIDVKRGMLDNVMRRNFGYNQDLLNSIGLGG